MQALQISAVVCAFISLLLLLIALGSDYWLANASGNIGLWKACAKVLATYTCGSLGMDVKDFVHVTRAFMFFGMIAGAISCIGLCGTFCSVQFGSISKAKTAAIASIVAALCVMIAMAVYTGETRGNAYYGWSFGLGWVSFPFFLVTGGLAFRLNAAATE
ncbi:protein NKG7-like [Podarcis raffonei]|uniref:protein NKG7-like n=1 Tax=Podarcis raffonei TaxID=65483 RepID=UPI002329811C|nr:protein NKG7-like [Podarcis raffonei]XP_053254193.1 protein NKG7-like [Podarcis raffonei]